VRRFCATRDKHGDDADHQQNRDHCPF
jgi:hypothetical protein